MKFPEYLEELAREHTMVKHKDDECHFSDMTVEYDNKLVRKMHYPMVAVDLDSFGLSGGSGQYFCNAQFNVYFLTHVRDTASGSLIREALQQTREIMTDFIARFSRDKRRLVPVVSRIELAQADGFPIFFKDISLYGWCLSVLCPEPLNDHLCNNHFEK